MSTLTTVIEKAAREFAQTIIGAVKESSLQELLALQGVAPRRGRQPQAKAKARKKIKWPKCKASGCKKNAWARGKGYCGEHAKTAKAKK